MATEMPVRTRKQAVTPYDPIEHTFNELTRFWSEPWPFFGRPFRWGRPGSMEHWRPVVDMFERNNKLVVKCDLPGLRKEDLVVSLEEGDLVIQGERKREHEVKEEDYYSMERATGGFYRRVRLPFDVEAGNIQARFENGVLEVEIPKPVGTKPQVEKVKVH